MRTLGLSLTALLLTLALGLALAGCNKPAEDKAAAGAQGGAPPAAAPAEVKQYTCPMHPEIVRDAPGKCPKCGMDLVEKAA